MTQLAIPFLAALVLALAAALVWQFLARRRANAALEQRTAQLAALIENSSQIVVLKDLDFRYVAVNSRYLETFGIANEDIVGKTITDIYEPAEAKALVAQDREVLATGAPVAREVHLTVQGNPRTLHCVKFPVRDDSDNIVGFGTISTDVTEQQHAEQELKDSEARLEALIEHSPLAIAVKDPDGRFLLANPKYHAIFGFRGQDIIGKTAYDLYSRDRAADFDRQDREAQSKGRPVAREIVASIQGETGTLLDIKFPILKASGEVLGIGYIGTDITDRKRAEAQLRSAKEAAEHADAAKSRFLAAASHDLRQPLYVLKLLFSVLQGEEDPEKSARILRDMDIALDSMAGILEALLDISRLDAGVVTPEVTNFRVDEFLHRIARQVTSETAAKGLDFHIVPSRLVIQSDQALLERVIQNFLSNAVRYTDKGRILLGCRRRGSHLSIEVWDTGPGIADDQKAAIFEPFYQVGNPARDRSQGLGLGLSIAERMADVLDHSLEVKSWFGKGSMFAIQVPLAPQQNVTNIQAGDAGGADLDCLVGVTVAVIDDDENVAAATRQLLESEGADVWVGGSYEHILAQLQDAGACPDVVIADYRLPEGANGIEAIENIGRDCGSGILPGLIVTGDTSPKILNQIEAAGLVALHKPVDPKVLVENVAQLLPGQQPKATAATS